MPEKISEAIMNVAAKSISLYNAAVEKWLESQGITENNVKKFRLQVSRSASPSENVVVTHVLRQAYGRNRNKTISVFTYDFKLSSQDQNGSQI